MKKAIFNPSPSKNKFIRYVLFALIIVTIFINATQISVTDNGHILDEKFTYDELSQYSFEEQMWNSLESDKNIDYPLNIYYGYINKKYNAMIKLNHDINTQEIIIFSENKIIHASDTLDTTELQQNSDNENKYITITDNNKNSYKEYFCPFSELCC